MKTCSQVTACMSSDDLKYVFFSLFSIVFVLNLTIHIFLSESEVKLQLVFLQNAYNAA